MHKIKHSLSLFLLLIAFPSSLLAQPYLHFPNPDALPTWKFDHSFFDMNAGCGAVANDVVTVDRDSVFNGHRYYNFKRLDFGYCDTWNSPCQGSGYVVSPNWVWTDTSSGKTYMYDPQLGRDTLIYDVSLNIGDTLRSALTVSWSTNIVTNVDTIVVGGIPRRRVIVLTDWDWTEYFMAEGMGSSAGPLTVLGPDVDYTPHILRCYAEDSTGLWINPTGCGDAAGCFTAVGREEAVPEGRLEVGPNPVQDVCRVHWTKGLGKTAVLELYSLDGRICKQSSWRGETSQEFELEGLPSGLYLLRVRTSFGTKNFRVVKD